VELAIRIQIEELPEGVYLATSDELPGLFPACFNQLAGNVTRDIEGLRNRPPLSVIRSRTTPQQTITQPCRIIPAIRPKARSARF